MTEKNKGGGTKGNKNSSLANRRWRQAIDKATKQYSCTNSDDPRKHIKAGEALDNMAIRLVDIALNGEGSDMVFAFKEIGSRLDGKATEHKVIESRTSEGLEGLSEAVILLRGFAKFAGNKSDEGVVQDGSVLLN